MQLRSIFKRHAALRDENNPLASLVSGACLDLARLDREAERAEFRRAPARYFAQSLVLAVPSTYGSAEAFSTAFCRFALPRIRRLEREDPKAFLHDFLAEEVLRQSQRVADRNRATNVERSQPTGVDRLPPSRRPSTDRVEWADTLATATIIPAREGSPVERALLAAWGDPDLASPADYRSRCAVQRAVYAESGRATPPTREAEDALVRDFEALACEVYEAAQGRLSGDAAHALLQVLGGTDAQLRLLRQRAVEVAALYFGRRERGAERDDGPGRAAL